MPEPPFRVGQGFRGQLCLWGRSLRHQVGATVSDCIDVRVPVRYNVGMSWRDALRSLTSGTGLVVRRLYRECNLPSASQ